MGGGRVLAALAVASCGCSRGALHAPDLPARGDVVLAVFDEGAPCAAVRVAAHAGGLPSPHVLTLEHLERGRVEALIYAEPLDALGIAPGEVACAEAAGSEPLPPASAVFALDLEGPRWAERTAPTLEVARFRFAPVRPLRPCPRFRRVMITEIAGQVVAIARAGEEAAIVATRGNFYRIDPSGTVTALSSTVTMRVDASYSASDGSAWFGSYEGCLVRVEPSDSSVRPCPRCCLDRGPILAITGTEAPFERLVVAGGSLVRFDGVTARAELLVQAPYRPRLAGAEAGDTLIQARRNSREVHRYRRGEGLVLTAIETVDVEAVTALTAVEGLGPVLATSGNTAHSLHRLEGETWHATARFPFSISNSIYDVVRYRDGIAFGGNVGYVAIHEGERTCDPFFVAPDSVDRVIALRGERILAFDFTGAVILLEPAGD